MCAVLEISLLTHGVAPFTSACDALYNHGHSRGHERLCGCGSDAFLQQWCTDLNNVHTVHPLLQPLIGHGKVRVHIVIPKLHSDIS